MDHMGKEMALVQQADKPSSVNLIYSLRWIWVKFAPKIIFCKTEMVNTARRLGPLQSH